MRDLYKIRILFKGDVIHIFLHDFTLEEAKIVKDRFDYIYKKEPYKTVEYYPIPNK